MIPLQKLLIEYSHQYKSLNLPYDQIILILINNSSNNIPNNLRKQMIDTYKKLDELFQKGNKISLTPTHFTKPSIIRFCMRTAAFVKI